MDQNLENKPKIKNKILNFYNSNKYKLFTLICISILIIITKILLDYNSSRKNNLMAEKYVRAGLYLNSNKTENAKTSYEEIVESGNEFYSILALNTIIEKELITNKDKILEYFNLLEENVSSKESRDLITFKKALYLIKFSNEAEGNALLENLSNNESNLKPLVDDILDR